eukprot:166559-Pyramimonas_sp.AAC.1
MGFNPWHTLEEHTPLGSLNRLRKQTYYVAQKERRELNGECPAHPTTTQVCVVAPSGEGV